MWLPHQPGSTRTTHCSQGNISLIPSVSFGHPPLALNSGLYLSLRDCMNSHCGHLFPFLLVCHNYRVLRPYFASENTHSTPPCGTKVLVPLALSSSSCLRWASTPQPDCTAMYWMPSI